MFCLSVPRTPGPAVCRIAAHDSRLRPRPPLSSASLQPASRWALLMSSSLSPDMGLFFPGLELGVGGEDRREGVPAGSAPGRGLRRETQEPGAENQTFQTILMDSLCMGVGRGGVRSVSRHMVHPKTEVHSLLFDLCCRLHGGRLAEWLLSAFTVQMLKPPSFARVVIRLKENAVPNGSVCLMLPAPRFCFLSVWCD